MPRAGDRHIEQAKLILVWYRAAVGTAQAEIIGHLDPLPFWVSER